MIAKEEEWGKENNERGRGDGNGRDKEGNGGR